MINNFREEGSGSPQNQIQTQLALQAEIDNLLEKFPKLDTYHAKQEEFLKKEKLLTDLRARFQKLDDESARIDNATDMPQDAAKNQKAGLKQGKMDAFELEKKTEKELMTLGNELDDIAHAVASELSEFKKLKKELGHKHGLE